LSDQNKPGSGLDDLKARLGLTTPTKPEPEPEPEIPAGEVGAFDPDAPTGETGAAAAPEEDYSASVMPEPKPLAHVSAPHPAYNEVDPSLSTPTSAGTRAALVFAILILFGLGTFIGFSFGKVMRERMVANEVIDDAAELLRAVTPVSSALIDLQGTLNEHGNEYSPELHQVLLDTFGSEPPALRATSVAGAHVVLTPGAEITRMLVNYAVGTQQLASLGQMHLAATIRDQPLIDELLSDAAAEVVNYAIHFENVEQTQAYYTFLDTPEEAPFTPRSASVVTYDTLEMIVVGEGEEQNHYYNVTDRAGRNGQANIYDVLLLGADQIVENSQEETALDRYRIRVAVLREKLNEVILMQRGLREALDERAAGTKRFAI